MEVAAKHKGAHISAQKARLVADQIRGKAVGEALNILAFSPQKGAALVKKVLESAIANAYAGADIISWAHKYCRTDIGKKGLSYL